MPATFVQIHSPILGAVFPARLDFPNYAIWNMNTPDPPMDLAMFIHAIRVWTGAGAGQVMAIIEFVNPVSGQVEYALGRSTYGHEHAEEAAFSDVVNRLPPNVHPQDIIARVFVEMQPCGPAVHNCHALFRDNAPFAVVMYGARFPDDYDNRKNANKRMRDSRDKQERFVRQKIQDAINYMANNGVGPQVIAY